MIDNLHYKISVRLVNPDNTDSFHTLEFLVPRDNICDDVVTGILVPTATEVTIEICPSYVIKRIDK